jgi:hypothetical protein
MLRVRNPDALTAMARVTATWFVRRSDLAKMKNPDPADMSRAKVSVPCVEEDSSATRNEPAAGQTSLPVPPPQPAVGDVVRTTLAENALSVIVLKNPLSATKEKLPESVPFALVMVVVADPQETVLGMTGAWVITSDTDPYEPMTLPVFKTTFVSLEPAESPPFGSFTRNRWSWVMLGVSFFERSIVITAGP